MPEEFVLPLENDSRSLSQEETRPLILRLDEGNTQQASVDLTKIYTDSLLYQNEAINAIQSLTPADRQRWRAFQIEIADSKNDGQRDKIKNTRDREFPEIARYLSQARKHIEIGTTLSDNFIKKQDNQPALTLKYPGTRPLLADRALPSTISVSPQMKELIERELNKGLPPGFKTPDRASNLAILNRGGLEITNLRGFPGRKTDQLTSSLSIKLADSKPSLQTSDKPPGLFDFNPRTNPFDLLRRDQTPLQPNLTRFLRNEPDPLALLRNSAEISLAALDKPGKNSLLQLKGEEACQLIASKSGGEVSEARLLQDLNVVNGSKKLTEQQKQDFIKELTRMVEAKGTDLRPESERAIIAAQLIHQASNIRTVDQGPNKTCNTGVVEKMMLADQPDVVARMIADVATTYSTKTESGRTIKIEPEWLKPHKPERLKYPPADDIRSMASHYFALIGVDVRFQLWNDQYNSKLKFAHVDGKDQVQDFSVKPPRPVYSANNETGKFETEQKPVMLDQKPKVNSDLEVIMKKPSRSPHVGSNGILDMYEELSGKSAKGKMIGNKSEIDYVDRAHTYSNENELHEILKKLALDEAFPAIFDQPGHVVTINGYDIKARKADYDNQWGDSDDKFGSNGATLKYLLEKGQPDPAKEKKNEEKDNRHREYRKEYEDWCEDLGIKADSRYPSAEELKQWRAKKS